MRTWRRRHGAALETVRHDVHLRRVSAAGWYRIVAVGGLRVDEDEGVGVLERRAASMRRQMRRCHAQPLT